MKTLLQLHRMTNTFDHDDDTRNAAGRPSGTAPRSRQQATFGEVVLEAAPDNAPPFPVEAIVLEEDTGLVITADFNIKDGAAHPIRIMTDLQEFQPEKPGTVVVKGHSPYRLLAIVHDFDREPACCAAWIRDSLRAALRVCAERGTTAVGFQLLGTRFGPFDERWFKRQLAEALAESPVPSLRRIWLMLPDPD